jgi:C_GCAxxG_C_C family probable redox protein
MGIIISSLSLNNERGFILMLPEKRDEIVRQASEKVRTYMPFHHSCSKGVNHALQDAFGIRDEGLFKAASGLHGGIGGQGDVCGAFLGASLMIGFMHGDGMDIAADPHEEEGEPGKGDEPTRMVSELYQYYINEYGSVKCDDLRGRFEAEVAADPSVKGFSEEELMMRRIAKCDEMASKAATRAAELMCDALD